jgi:hypothetical protein
MTIDHGVRSSMYRTGQGAADTAVAARGLASRARAHCLTRFTCIRPSRGYCLHCYPWAWALHNTPLPVRLCRLRMTSATNARGERLLPAL